MPRDPPVRSDSRSSNSSCGAQASQRRSADVRHPELKLSTPAHTKKPGWYAEFEFRVTHATPFVFDERAPCSMGGWAPIPKESDRSSRFKAQTGEASGAAALTKVLLVAGLSGVRQVADGQISGYPLHQHCACPGPVRPPQSPMSLLNLQPYQKERTHTHMFHVGNRGPSSPSISTIMRTPCFRPYSTISATSRVE